MDWRDFRDAVCMVSQELARELRKKYISSFVNTEKEYYKKYIENLILFSDGLCYTGYLWDCIDNPVMISEEYICSKDDESKNVYVMWDIHSKDRIFIENYWKFGKESILQVDYATLIRGLNYLPEDIYIFDEGFEWSLIFTHEYVDEKRWCLKVGHI